MTSVSVIIPVHNRGRLLARALDSVLGQTRPAEEIIVVDDGSTDDSAGIVAAGYPDVRLLQQRQLGVSTARNAGIREASGDWIALLDSDDTWLPGKLERQLQMQQTYPAYRLIHCDEIWIRNGIRVNPMHKHRKRGGRIFRHCLPRCIISPSAALIHRRLLEQIGLFDETLPVCEDYDLWLRICAQWPVLFVDEALLVKYGGHPDQLSRRYWGMDRFRIRALRKIVTSGCLDPDDRRAAIEALLQKIRIYVQGADKHNNHLHVEEFTQLAELYSSELRAADVFCRPEPASFAVPSRRCLPSRANAREP